MKEKYVNIWMDDIIKNRILGFFFSLLKWKRKRYTVHEKEKGEEEEKKTIIDVSLFILSLPET